MGKYDKIFTIDKVLLNIGSYALSVIRLPIIIRDHKYLKNNSKLHEFKKHDRCYIIGLGPSLKKVDFSKIEGDVIATNRFVNYKESIDLQPNYYCLTDAAFYNTNNLETIKIAENRYKDCAFVLNGKYRDIAERVMSHETNKFYAYMWSGYYSGKKKIDLTRRTPIAGNIVCFAIMLAMFLNYKEIILLGCDFNSFASRKEIHCYEERDSKRQISMSFELFCYSFVADTHYELNKYAESHGIKIINATENSLIDAYYYDEIIVKNYLRK